MPNNRGPHCCPYNDRLISSKYGLKFLADLTVAGKRIGTTSSWRQELSGIIAQCLNLEHEIHHSVSKLCILRFDPIK
jgi:hypothetical protein